MRFRPPLLGECVFYTRGLKYNFELIFFWGPGGWLAQSTVVNQNNCIMTQPMVATRTGC